MVPKQNYRQFNFFVARVALITQTHVYFGTKKNVCLTNSKKKFHRSVFHI
jgi:hypothetical protein